MPVSLSDQIRQIIEKKMQITEFKQAHPEMAQMAQLVDEYLQMFEVLHSQLSLVQASNAQHNQQ